MSSIQILLARQPIYDNKLEIVAYELLYRPINHLLQGNVSGDQATSEVVLHAFTEIGLDNLTEGKRAFINFTSTWILTPPPFNNNLIVIEILEDTQITDEILGSVLALKKKGYGIALDDFIYHEKWEKILPHVDIVKVDLRENKKEDLAKTIDKLKVYNCELLAEKVETYEELLYCKGLGFTLFQGFFLCRPQSIKGRNIPPNKLVVTSLLQELQNPDAKVDQIESLVAKDPSLSYKIMRIVNSPAVGAHKQIASLHQAITMLGLNQIQQWASVIALSQLADKPSALVLTAMVRGRMCEQIAAAVELPNKESYFSLGLFSTLDAFMDQSLEKILDSLPLTDDINKALTRYEGNYGTILHSVICHEQANWEQIKWQDLSALKISAETFESAYLSSVEWARDSFSAIISDRQSPQ